jgi:site-specific recombinase XerD
VTTAVPSAAPAAIQPVFTGAERLGLTGYRGLTREAYALDLEAWARAHATFTRRLSTIAGFYKYAVEEKLLSIPLPAHARRPRLDVSM